MKRCHIKAETWTFRSGAARKMIAIPVVFPIDLSYSVAAYCYEKTNGCEMEGDTANVPVPKNRAEVVETLAGYFKSYGQIYDSDRFRNLGEGWEKLPQTQKIKTAITKLFGF